MKQYLGHLQAGTRRVEVPYYPVARRKSCSFQPCYLSARCRNAGYTVTAINHLGKMLTLISGNRPPVAGKFPPLDVT